MPKPAVGRIVHYVSHGTPGGEYGKECRAAIITAVPKHLPGSMEPLDGCPNGTQDHWVVGLAVLNPTGAFFNTEVRYHDGAEQPGDPGCDAAHGSPFRYCGCGWAEAEHAGGTWHWPERVD
ncbi:hypothetical protein [Streptomyces sp. NPDC093261]|uniref:hypothetical protein n=1 Tax=Streptomyces sp. NPDC093261 TaxID=3366037 RepID=UPI0038043AF8